MPNEKQELNAAADETHTASDDQKMTPANDGDGVDTLVAALRSHIEVAEERHSDVLTDMRERLGALGGDVNDIRDRIPMDLSGTLAGIETGIESLHERVAQIATPGGVFSDTIEASENTPENPGESSELMDFASREDHAETGEDAFETDTSLVDSESEPAFAIDSTPFDLAQQDASAAHDETSEDPSIETDISNSEAVETADTPTPAPAALKSATDTWDTETNNEAAPASEMHAIDTFDMVETSMPGDPNSPWDEESAAALTRVYDEPVSSVQNATSDQSTHMPARTPDPEVTDANNKPADEQRMGDGDGGDQSGDRVSVDRAWLDSKFAEIAARIEQTLAELDPEKTAAVLGEQIQTIEHRVETALQDVATRSDLEGLKDLESHVTGMANQLAQTETHMQRLDTIEGTLHEVVQRFTEGAGSPFSAGDGAGSGPVDADHVAEVAAARIADHLAASGQAGDQSALADVRHMFDEFLNQQRQDSAQTSATLDTIQDAMVQILDRLDALEGGQPLQAPAPTQAIGEHYGEPIDVAAAEGWSSSGEGQGSDDDIELTDPGHLAGSAPAPAYGHEQEADVEIHQSGTGPAQDRADATASLKPPAEPADQLEEAETQIVTRHEQPQAPGTPSPDLLSDRMDPVLVPSESGGQSRDTIDKIRHNFIADAQQAKAKAAQAAVQEQDVPKKSGRATVLAGMRAGSDSAAPAAGFFASKTKRLLIGALIAVIVIQGALFLIPRGDDPATEAPASVTTPADDAKDGGAAKSKLEKSSTLVPHDGFAPAVSDAVVLDDLRAAITDARGRAGGAVDLPFGLVLHQTTAKEWTKEGRPIYGGDDATVTPIALASEAALPTVNGVHAQTTKVPRGSSARIAMPPLTVGPTSLRMAAANGDPSAQFEVATRLAEGKGTKQNFKEAATWLKRSAGQGFAQAQYRLGTLYERGLGVSRDAKRAQMWYLRAAEQGNIRAMHNLAVLNAGQASGSPDYSRAARWFLKAAESGLADSQFNVGVLYENGLGVSKDLVQAYKWYTLAARTGDQESLKRSQKIRQSLDIDVLGQAETAVRGFKPARVEPLVNNARLAGQQWKTRDNS